MPINLHIQAVWQESSQGAFCLAKDAKFLHADNKDWSDCADVQANLSQLYARLKIYFLKLWLISYLFFPESHLFLFSQLTVPESTNILTMFHEFEFVFYSSVNTVNPCHAE